MIMQSAGLRQVATWQEEQFVYAVELDKWNPSSSYDTFASYIHIK